MTVLSVSNADKAKKTDHHQLTPTQDVHASIKEGGEVVDFVERTYGQPGVLPIDLYLAKRRRRMFLWLAIILLLLWLMVVAVLSSVLVYRYFNRSPFVWGWCGADVMVGGRHERLQQRVEVAMKDSTERIEVPKFGPNRPAVFLHDFKENLTAIVDIRDRRCFVKESGSLVAPKNYVDLFDKMKDGYYEQDAKIAHENYVARYPPMTLKEISSLGSEIINEQCQGLTTYWLQPIRKVEITRFRRALTDNSFGASVGAKKRDNCGEDTFAEFVPMHGVYEFHIALDCPKTQ